jgi:polyisoprenoid-binding protein YceI
MRKISGLFLGIVLLAATAFAADEYKIDPVHSRVGFAVNHMVINTVHGRFNDFSGSILFDDKDISKSSVSVTIKTASINTDNTQRDSHLRSADFLDVANFPEIAFKSKAVEKKGNEYVAHGTLTIRGVSKDVDLLFQLKGPVNLAGKKFLGAEASLTINRQDFGVSWSKALDKGQLVVGNDVQIEINTEAGEVKASAPAGK